MGGLFLYRKFVIEDLPVDINRQVFNDKNFFYGIFAIPLIWIVLHFIAGSYTDIYRKSRLAEITRTFVVSFIGVLIIFFALLLDDYVSDYRDYYQIFFLLFGGQFFGNGFIAHGNFNQSKTAITKRCCCV